MPKYVVKVQPSGLLNGHYWPDVGESIDLSAEVGDIMVDAGNLERVAEKKAEKVEKRPASKVDVETRKGS